MLPLCIPNQGNGGGPIGGPIGPPIGGPIGPGGPPGPHASGPGIWPLRHRPHKVLLLALCKCQFKPMLKRELIQAWAWGSEIARAHAVSIPIDRSLFMAVSRSGTWDGHEFSEPLST